MRDDAVLRHALPLGRGLGPLVLGFFMFLFFQLFPSGSPIVLDPRGKLGGLGAGEEFGDNQGWYIMVIFMSACIASHGFSHKKCLLMQTVHCRSGYICEFKL